MSGMLAPPLPRYHRQPDRLVSPPRQIFCSALHPTAHNTTRTVGSTPTHTNPRLPQPRPRRRTKHPATLRASTLCAVTERTLALIKPDGVERRLVGEVLSRVERKGLTLVALELKDVSEDLARAHYAEHDGKPFFGSLLEFITSGPVVAAILEGPRAVAAFRPLAGGTDPVEKAAPGTIRGDFGLETQFNLVHGSDSPESAEREISLWFPDF